MPDEYTTTSDPLQPLVCTRCGKDFDGHWANIFDNGGTVLCDECKAAP